VGDILLAFLLLVFAIAIMFYRSEKEMRCIAHYGSVDALNPGAEVKIVCHQGEPAHLISKPRGLAYDLEPWATPPFFRTRKRMGT